MIELVDREQLANEVPAENKADAEVAQAPVTQKVIVEWVNGKGVVNVSFDRNEFGTWPLVIAALDLAKRWCEDMLEQAKMGAMAAIQEQVQQAARLQAKLSHQQNQNQQRRR